MVGNYTSIDPKQQHPFFQESDLPFREFFVPPLTISFSEERKKRKVGKQTPEA